LVSQEGNNVTRAAPDAMVALVDLKATEALINSGKKYCAPQVVFEVRSPGNTQTEMDKKLVFYDRRCRITCMTPDKGDLSGWLRTGERLDVIEPISG